MSLQTYLVYAYQVFVLNQTRFDFFLRPKRLGVPVVVRDDDGAYAPLPP
jgi:hypothetical protein